MENNKIKKYLIDNYYLCPECNKYLSKKDILQGFYKEKKYSTFCVSCPTCNSYIWFFNTADDGGVSIYERVN